jgi:hypothetical protein
MYVGVCVCIFGNKSAAEGRPCPMNGRNENCKDLLRDRVEDGGRLDQEQNGLWK